MQKQKLANNVCAKKEKKMPTHFWKGVAWKLAKWPKRFSLWRKGQLSWIFAARRCHLEKHLPLGETFPYFFYKILLQKAEQVHSLPFPLIIHQEKNASINSHWWCPMWQIAIVLWALENLSSEMESTNLVPWLTKVMATWQSNGFLLYERTGKFSRIW